jgi:hypothetical protein
MCANQAADMGFIEDLALAISLAQSTVQLIHWVTEFRRKRRDS